MTTNMLNRYAMYLFALVFALAMPLCYSQEEISVDKADVEDVAEDKGNLKNTLQERIDRLTEIQECQNIYQFMEERLGEGDLGRDEFEELLFSLSKKQVAILRNKLENAEKIGGPGIYLQLADLISQSTQLFVVPNDMQGVVKEYGESMLRMFDNRRAQCKTDQDFENLYRIMRTLGQYNPDRGAVEKRMKELQDYRLEKGIEEFRRMLKDGRWQEQPLSYIDMLKRQGATKEQIKELKDELNEAYGKRIHEEVTRLDVSSANRQRFNELRMMLEKHGVEGQYMDEINGILTQIDNGEKLSRFYKMLANDRYKEAQKYIGYIKNEGVSEDMLSQMDREVLEGYKEYFQRKVWAAIGQDNYFRDNMEKMLDEPKWMGVDDATIEKWRGEIRDAVRTKALRTLRYLLRLEEEFHGVSGFIYAASVTGCCDELMAELRAQVSEAMVADARRLISYHDYKKAQKRVEDLEKCGCEVPADVSAAINAGLREGEIKRFRYECLRFFNEEELSPEVEQKLRDRAAALEITEETLNQWREEAKK